MQSQPNTSRDTDPPLFVGRLLPHQHDGVRWLLEREECATPGGILADEMGLGKTVQILAMMCRNHRKTLIVVPKSLVGQWANQIREFTTLQHVHLCHGLGSKNDVRHAARTTDVCICTYEYAVSFDFDGATFDRIVLDEAHRIKNTRSKTHQRIAAIPARIRWAVTGTPLLSRKRDFCSLVEWIGARSASPNDIMLRRTFEDVGERVKLPPCNFDTHTVDLSDNERRVYNKIVAEGKEVPMDDASLLRTMFRLQQCLISLDFVGEPCIGVGSKILCLMDIAGDRNVNRLLVFTHHRNELDVVAAACEYSGLLVETMDGTTPCAKRQTVANWFNEKTNERRALVTNMGVGAVGMNLPAADTIIFVSGDWVPGIEMQAVARAHRIGCSHRVTVHRIIARGTVDEHVARIQTKKLDEVSRLFDDPRIRARFGGKLLEPLKKTFLSAVPSATDATVQ